MASPPPAARARRDPAGRPPLPPGAGRRLRPSLAAAAGRGGRARPAFFAETAGWRRGV